MHRNILPNVGDIVFLLILFLLFVTLPNFVLGDGSTGWHLVAGRYMLETLSIPQQDLISYTFAEKPWVAYEWLADLIAALLVKVGGMKLLAVATSSAIAWLFLLLYQDCRKAGCHFLLSLLFIICGALVSAIHWLARPHIFTFFGVYVFSRCLDAFYDGRLSAKKLYLILSLTMLIWANTHPAFLIGIVLILVYLFSASFFVLCGDNDARSAALTRIKPLATMLALASLATLINPFGLRLHSYILHYLQMSTVLSATDEYRSPSFHGELQPTCLELLFGALLIGLTTTTKKLSLPQLILLLLFGHLALSSLRNWPLFVIVVLPILATLFAYTKIMLPSEQHKIGEPSWLIKARSYWQHLGKTFDDVEYKCTMHLLPLAAVILLCLSCFNDGKIFGLSLVTSTFDPKTKPTSTLRYIVEHKLPYNSGFNYDNWGGYIAYKLGMRVFIDDRADFYGQDFYLQYAKVSLLEPGWQEVLAKYKIKWVLMPKNSMLVAGLKQEPSWKLAAEDPAACLYVSSK